MVAKSKDSLKACFENENIYMKGIRKEIYDHLFSGELKMASLLKS